MTFMRAGFLAMLIVAGMNGTVSANGRATARKTITELYLYTFHGLGAPARPDINYCAADQIFPRLRYPREFEAANGTLSAFHSVTLENDLLYLVQVSDLGGQTFAFRDKRTGMDIAYSSKNPKLSWTFALQKGAHVAFPVTEHGLNSLEPWPVTIEEDSAGASIVFTKVDELTGLRMRVTTFMPHRGYYIDKTAVLENPMPAPRKGMMWSVHVVENHPGARLFWPARHSYAHTGMSLPYEDGFHRAVVDYHGPIPAGRVIDLARWPAYHGMYGADFDRNWAAIHNVAQRRGLVKIMGKDASGLKFYGDGDHAELFVGFTPTLESYGRVEPGSRTVIRERILPTTGMTWISAASRAGVAGIFRRGGGDSLAVEALICEDPGDTVRLSLRQGERELTTCGRLARPGEIIRCTVPWSRVRSGPRAVPVTVSATSAHKKIVTYTVESDSIVVLDDDDIRRVPVDSVLAAQASAWRYSREIDSSRAARTAGPAITAVSGSLPLAACFGDTSADNDPPRRPRGMHMKAPGGAVRRGDTTYCLLPRRLLIIYDTLDSRPANTAYCYNSSYQRLLDTAYLDAKPAARKVPLDKVQWYTTPALLDTALVLGRDKRLEVRDLAGAYLDSIHLGAWVGHVERYGPHEALVTLPYECAVAVVDVRSGQVRRHSLRGVCGFRYPWAATPTPRGWAFSSATDYRILKTDARFEGGEIIEAPFGEPWRRQFRGINALRYHPSLDALLAADLDNMRIVKLGLDGEFRGVFTDGGLQDSTTLHVRHISLDTKRNVLATHFYSTMGKVGTVSLFDEQGRFQGSAAQLYRGALQWCNWIVPDGASGFVGFSAWANALQRADSNATVLKNAGHHGWTPGNFISVAGAKHRNGQGWARHARYGYFIADLIRHRVLHFDTSLTFVGEWAPDVALNTFSPTALAVDPAGRVHVVDGSRNRVFRFEPSDSGYAETGSYGADAGICLQRIYAHGDHIVCIDAFARAMVRFDSRGRIAGRGALPTGFVASILSVTDDRGNLYVRDWRSELAVRIDPRGRVGQVDIPGFAGDILTINRLADFERWRAHSRPDKARYAAITEHAQVRWLDEGFAVITAEQKDEFTFRDVAWVAAFDSVVMYGVRGFAGVAIRNANDTVLTWVDLGFDGSHCEKFRRKSNGVYGAIIEPSHRYIEFSLDGAVAAMSGRLGARFWNWSYTPSGNVLIPDHRSGLIMEFTPEGTLVSKTQSGIEHLEAALIAPDSVMYALSWTRGVVTRIGGDGAMDTLFTGQIEDRRRPDRCAWFELWDDDKLLAADNSNGKINVLGLDGTFRGSWPAQADDRRWRNKIWCGQSPHNGVVTFWHGRELVFVRFAEEQSAQ